MGDSVNKVVFGSDTLIDLTSDTATPDMVADGLYFHQANGVRTAGTAKYAGSPSVGGPATMANAIHWGKVDSTSTATAFTAQISGITEYYEGLTVILKNGVVASTTNCTLNINSLGALPIYPSTSDTRVSSAWAKAYTMIFVYTENKISGTPCWEMQYGMAYSNTIGYQLRTNSSTRPFSDRCYRYRLLFTSADGTHLVPANADTQTSAAKIHTVNTRPIDPFGEIYYLYSSSSFAAEASPGATTLWQQYVVTLGYSFNDANAALTLTTGLPVYIKATPQSDGSAVLDYFTQALPATDDGKIYIYLGIAVSGTTVEMTMKHPIYCYKNGAVRQWTNSSITETDPTVPSWAKQPSKPTYTASEVGALPDSTSIPTKTSDLTNDSGFITSYTDTKNTAGSTNDATNKLYLIGATEQSANPQTYSYNQLYYNKGLYSQSDVASAGEKYTRITQSNASLKMEGSTPTTGGSVEITNGVVKIIGLSDPINNKDAANKQYVDSAVSGVSVPSPSDETPSALGTASAGVSVNYSRADHVHAKPTYTASEVSAIPATLTSDFYGTTLPAAGTPGRIFFLKV